MPCLTENYDVAVVGAGHAGCEAALASARLGLETIVFTVSVDSIALMPWLMDFALAIIRHPPLSLRPLSLPGSCSPSVRTAGSR